MGFSTKSESAKTSRYSFTGATRDTEEGVVGVAVPVSGNSKREYLVHELSRSSEAISLSAVAVAITHGCISPDALVRAFEEEGTLDALTEAIQKRQPAPAPAAPEAKPGK